MTAVSGPLRRRVRDDRGVASVLALAVVGALVAAALGALTLIGGVADRQRVTVAADTAALGAARDAWLGPATACATADLVVRAQRAELMSCAVIDEVAQVRVRDAQTDGWLPRAEAIARAGPDVDSPGL